MPMGSNQEPFVPAPTVNFANIGQEAIKMADSIAATPAPEVPSVPSPAPVTASPDGSTLNTPLTPPDTSVVAPQDGQSTLSPAELKTFELDLGNGRVEKLTEAQIKDNYLGGLRLADYTRKTTEAATAKREAQALLEQAKQKQAIVQLAEQLVSNPQLAYQIAQQRSGQVQPQYQQPQQQFQQPAIDPNTPVTYEQMVQMANGFQNQIHQLQQGTAGQQQAIQQYAQQLVTDKLEVANYAESINTTLGGVFQKHPALKAIPEMEDIIRYRVAKMEPETLEEAQKAFETVADEIAQNIGKPFNDRQQQQTIARQTLATQGIEPPGGSAPQPTKQSFNGPAGKIDWTKLKQAALDMGGSR